MLTLFGRKNGGESPLHRNIPQVSLLTKSTPYIQYMLKNLEVEIRFRSEFSLLNFLAYTQAGTNVTTEGWGGGLSIFERNLKTHWKVIKY